MANDVRKNNAEIHRGDGKAKNAKMVVDENYATGGRASGGQPVYQDMEALRTGSNIKRRG